MNIFNSLLKRHYIKYREEFYQGHSEYIPAYRKIAFVISLLGAFAMCLTDKILIDQHRHEPRMVSDIFLDSLLTAIISFSFFATCFVLGPALVFGVDMSIKCLWRSIIDYNALKAEAEETALNPSTSLTTAATINALETVANIGRALIRTETVVEAPVGRRLGEFFELTEIKSSEVNQAVRAENNDNDFYKNGEKISQCITEYLGGNAELAELFKNAYQNQNNVSWRDVIMQRNLSSRESALI